MGYSDLLKDPRWQKKRLKIFERDEFTCRHCLASDKPLNVHHVKYFGAPWDIEDKYLITLCEDCHEFEESLKPVDIYDELRELGLTKYQAKILIHTICEKFAVIKNQDFFSWEDTIKQAFKWIN